MQAAKFNQLIKSPSSIEKEDFADLQQLVSDFPYFQSAHMLLNLAAKRYDTNIYEKSLKKTAIIVSNRAHLFNLIHAQDDAIEKMLNLASNQAIKQPEITNQAISSTETTSLEDVQEELAILKATEIADEQNQNKENVQALKTEQNILETEIAKQVVLSIVDKEIINPPIQRKEEKPVHPVTDDKPESFSDWLAFLKKNNGQSYVQIEQKVNDAKEQKQLTKPIENIEKLPVQDLTQRKQKNKALIDRIIDSNPGTIKIKEEQKFYVPDAKAKESLLDNEHLVTETLAKIYALQGNVSKAIRAYQILSLKFPQKSVYFASLIQKLKNNE